MYDSDKRSFSEFVCEYVIFPSLVAVTIGLPISLIVGNWMATKVVQTTLNSQCKTNYSQLDVYLAKDDLWKLCQMKEQQITIRK